MLVRSAVLCVLISVAPLCGCGDDESTPSQAAASAGVGGAAGGDATGTAGGGTGPGGFGGAGSCDDTVLEPEDDPMQSCSNIPDCSGICEVATSKMKAGIAGNTIQCMAGKCDCPMDVNDCYEQAHACTVQELAKACPDPSTVDDCAAAIRACGLPPPGPTCIELLDGLTEAARAEVLACAEAGCPGGLATCVEQSFTP